MPRKCKTDIALDALNDARGLKYPQKGYSYFANVAGAGRNYRSIYVIINDGGGVTYSGLNHMNAVRQVTQIEHATRIALGEYNDGLRRCTPAILIMRAIHARGTRQRLVLAEMERRGLWLDAVQKRQAGLAE